MPLIGPSLLFAHVDLILTIVNIINAVYNPEVVTLFCHTSGSGAVKAPSAEGGIAERTLSV